MASDAAASSNSPTWVRIGSPGRGRGVDHRQVADAGQRHLQGAGNRAGRQGEDIDPVGQRLDRLLVAHPEPLLLVHHQEPELLEVDVDPEQPVGPDHHIHRSVGQSGQDRLGLGVGQEPAEHLHLHRERRIAVGEGLGVLTGQQRRGHQDGSLKPVLDRLEHGPDGHLGLAEAHVAADQPVHGLGPLHVRFDLLDGTQLIGGLDEREGRLELGLPRGVRAEGVAGDLEPAAVEGDEFLGDLVHRRPGLGAGPLPLRPAQPAHRGRVATGVRREQLDLVGGEVELVRPPVLEEQIVAGGAPHGPGDHAPVPGHPVLTVDDIAARGQIVEEAVDGPGPGPGLAVGTAAPGDVGLGEHGDPRPGQDEAAVDRRDHDAGTGSGEIERSVRQVGGDRYRQSLLGQNPREALGSAGGRGAEDDRVPVADEGGDLAGQLGSVAEDGLPSPALHQWDVRPLGRGHQGDDPGRGAGQEAVEGDVQAGCAVTGLEPPRTGQGVGQRRLLVEQLAGPVADPAGFDQHHQRVGHPAGR